MKPMLLNNEEYDLSLLDYTKKWYISRKRDGVRVEVSSEGIKNRSLKTLRNSKLQEYFQNLTTTVPKDIILEGELYSDSIPCREMAGIANSLNKDFPEDTQIYLFGLYDENKTFEERLEKLHSIYNTKLGFNITNFSLVRQEIATSYEQVLNKYNEYLAQGYEGAVLMRGDGLYKKGRVTVREQIGYKIKPSREDDLKIIGVEERMENTNESLINELGYSYKKNTVDAKKPTGIAATFICELNNNLTVKVTITGTEEFRREVWNNKTKYIGKYAVVKSMDYGAKNKLRHPRLIKIKEVIEK